VLFSIVWVKWQIWPGQRDVHVPIDVFVVCVCALQYCLGQVANLARPEGCARSYRRLCCVRVCSSVLFGSSGKPGAKSTCFPYILPNKFEHQKFLIELGYTSRP
jgi:hypothetical protein